MPNVILPNLGIELPDVGSDQDTWGNILNAGLQTLDNAVQYDVISKTLSNVDVTLTAAEAASAVINLTGTLTANVNVIVPATPVRVYLVRNQTSGAFTVTVKTAAGTGAPVQQSTSSLVYSDGTNIIQGATSVNGSFAVSGALTAGSLNNTPVGNTTPSSGAFTTLSASGATTLNGAVTLGDEAADAITVNGALSYTSTLTGGTGVVNIGSGQLYKSAAGLVGIGTSSPSNKIHVVDPSSASIVAQQTSATPADVQIAASSAGVGVVGTVGNYPLAFRTNSVERMRLDGNNFGIGTSAPAFRVDVGVSSTLTNDQQVALRLKSTTTADMVDGFGVTQLFSIQDSLGSNFNIAQIRAVRSGADDSGAIVFAPYNAGAANERMRIDSAGRLLHGTTAASTGAFAEFTSTTGALIVPRMTTAQRDAMGAVANGAIIYNTTTNKMNFRENGAWVQPTVTAA